MKEEAHTFITKKVWQHRDLFFHESNKIQGGGGREVYSMDIETKYS